MLFSWVVCTAVGLIWRCSPCADITGRSYCWWQEKWMLCAVTRPLLGKWRDWGLDELHSVVSFGWIEVNLRNIRNLLTGAKYLCGFWCSLWVEMSRSAGILYTRFFLSGSNFHLGFNFFEVLLSYHFTLTIFTDRGADAEKVQEHAGGWGSRSHNQRCTARFCSENTWFVCSILVLHRLSFAW